jgi:hypothetical protein
MTAYVFSLVCDDPMSYCTYAHPKNKKSNQDGELAEDVLAAFCDFED